MKIRYMAKRIDYETEDKDRAVREVVLCFNCAVLETTLFGSQITPEIDNFDDCGCDMRVSTCEECHNYIYG